jgi:hypothetical protein
MRDLFQSVNTDCSGVISIVEFARAMNILAPELSEDDISHIFKGSTSAMTTLSFAMS